MSSPYYRIGPNPASGIIPLPITELFYLAYLDVNGREQSAFSYDAASKTFTALVDTPVSIVQDSAHFALSIGGNQVLLVDDQTLFCEQFSELELPSGVDAVMFYRKTSSIPTLLAAVSSNGTLFTKRLVEQASLPSGTQFELSSDSIPTVGIGPSGLFALNLSEDGPELATDGGDFLIFSDGSRWAI